VTGFIVQPNKAIVGANAFDYDLNAYPLPMNWHSNQHLQPA
jgi:hypothetical protein